MQHRLKQVNGLKTSNKNADDESGDGGGGSDDGGLLLTPGRRYDPRAGLPGKDSFDALINRYNKLKNAKYYPSVGLPRVSDSELQILASKGLVKGRKSDDGRFISVLSDTPPPTPVRHDYFPPPPVDLADNDFASPDVPTKPPIVTKPVLDNFSRKLTKIIDSKKNKMILMT